MPDMIDGAFLSREAAGALIRLSLAMGAMLGSGAHAAAPPAPPPDAATAASTALCPKLPPQPTEQELAAARVCAEGIKAALPAAPTGSGGAGAGSSGGGVGSTGPGGPGVPGAPDNSTSRQSPANDLHGPYLVHQTQTLGRESISGSACDQAQAFDVHFATPPASFNAGFVPSAANGQSGRWSYAYNIPRAGESHAAQGTYTLQADAAAHALHVKMTGSDHVAFKGFDGNMPIDYQFDLVAAPGAPCMAPH